MHEGTCERRVSGCHPVSCPPR
ncbi:hypothetical protein E2C01_068240 [Portunus trituberculatus]|uniref:Uncharacterized protein n=1 Tax=Portunus trituberculatus TaxID=210409 RepID=A0A5B7HYW0_PORTR|nr:hypothetical protein [Portunus trituberculatus]